MVLDEVKDVGMEFHGLVDYVEGVGTRMESEEGVVDNVCEGSRSGTKSEEGAGDNVCGGGQYGMESEKVLV